MAFITLRQANVITSPGATVKGSPLTNAEVDNNFSNINIVIGFRENLITSANANLVAAVNEVRSDLDNLSSDKISNGTSNVNISTANGDIEITANLVPNAGNVINLGASARPFKDLFLSGNTIHLGNTTIKSEFGVLKFNDVGFLNAQGNLIGNISPSGGVITIDASSIISGTLPVTRGGTGNTAATFVGLTSNVYGLLPAGNGGTGFNGSSASNGQLPIGNGSGFTANTLTGTSNQISVTNGVGSIILSTPQSINTTSSVQFATLGIGTGTFGSTGDIRATNNITAFFSSDNRYKENIRDIDRALDKVVHIGGKYFDWTDDYISSQGGPDGYFMIKSDFGVIAQDVKEVFPVAVRERSDGSLAVDYEKLVSLAFAAIKELKLEIEDLKRN